MSVKHSLLAVLADGDRYGYQLRAEFEERTGATWPLNIGQVYTTLNRLERDGFVEPAGQDAQNHVFYRITDEGRAELLSWFARPVTRAERPRDELAVKLALAVTVDGIDVGGIVHAQRKHALAALQDYTRVKARLAVEELAAALVVESMIFQCEAEIRWLDHVEARVLRHKRAGGTVGTPRGVTTTAAHHAADHAQGAPAVSATSSSSASRSASTSRSATSSTATSSEGNTI